MLFSLFHIKVIKYIEEVKEYRIYPCQLAYCQALMERVQKITLMDFHPLLCLYYLVYYDCVAFPSDKIKLLGKEVRENCVYWFLRWSHA